jgi:hypothetical protein
MEMQKDKSAALESGPREKFGWGQWIIAACGAGIFVPGVWRFYARHQFGYMDAVYCCAAVIPAALLLLIIDYTIHHAKLAALIPILFCALLVGQFPVFDVAFGLVLIGVAVGPAMREQRDEDRRRKAEVRAGENEGETR